MYDFYGVYTSCRDAAWRCILDFNIRSLPVKLKETANRAGIRVVRNSAVFELEGSESGAGIFCGGKWHIIYDDSLDTLQSRFVIAHELGHIFLGHEYKYADARFDTSDRKLKCEREADMFAVRLLSPACVLHEIGLFNADDISHVCGIPRNVAAERARRMKQLETRGAFYRSPLETEVGENFADFVREYRITHK